MKSVPFYPNLKDNVHCYQAALMMILGYFLPDRHFSYKKIDSMTCFQKGLWTWPIRGLISLIDMGFKIKVIEDFDYKKFSMTGIAYMRKKYGLEVAREQEIHGDIKQAQEDFKKSLDRIDYEVRIPDINEIRLFLQQGFLIICNVNSKSLNHKAGYEGHFVVIFDITSDHIILHDPGLPPIKNRRITIKEFITSWAYQNNEAKGLMTFKLEKFRGGLRNS